MTNLDTSRIEWHTNHRRRRCPRCRGFSSLTHSILDSQCGNVIRLYHCGGCGQHLWDDGSKFLAESVTELGAFRD